MKHKTLCNQVSWTAYSCLAIQKFLALLNPKFYHNIYEGLRLDRNQLTNFMDQSPWEANSRSASQEVTCLLGTRRSIIVFARVCYWSQFWASRIQSTSSKTIFLMSILISSIYALSLQRGPFPLGYPGYPNFTCISHLFNACCMTAQLIVLDLITLIMFGEEYKLWSSL